MKEKSKIRIKIRMENSINSIFLKNKKSKSRGINSEIKL